MEVVMNSFVSCSVWNKRLVENGCCHALVHTVRGGILVENLYFHHIVSLRNIPCCHLMHFLLISNPCGITMRYLSTAKKFIDWLDKRKTFFAQNTYHYVKKYTISE